jgi:hypothetical protein
MEYANLSKPKKALVIFLAAGNAFVLALILVTGVAGLFNKGPAKRIFHPVPKPVIQPAPTTALKVAPKVGAGTPKTSPVAPKPTLPTGIRPPVTLPVPVQTPPVGVSIPAPVFVPTPVPIPFPVPQPIPLPNRVLAPLPLPTPVPLPQVSPPLNLCLVPLLCQVTSGPPLTLP